MHCRASGDCLSGGTLAGAQHAHHTQSIGRVPGTERGQRLLGGGIAEHLDTFGPWFTIIGATRRHHADRYVLCELLGKIGHKCARCLAAVAADRK